MKTTLFTIILVCALGAPCLAGTVSISTQVNVTNGVKQYVYTFTNNLDAGELNSVLVFVPRAGWDRIASLSVSRTDWYVGTGNRGADEWHFGAQAFSGGSLSHGQSVALTLTTAATVPTVYTFAPPGFTGNWGWATLSDVTMIFPSSSVPVPVPEPGGLIGLVTGLGMFGIPLLRGRGRR